MINKKSLVAQVNLKSDENGHALKMASDTLCCFVEMLLHFVENRITFYFTNIVSIRKLKKNVRNF